MEKRRKEARKCFKKKKHRSAASTCNQAYYNFNFAFHGLVKYLVQQVKQNSEVKQYKNPPKK